MQRLIKPPSLVSLHSLIVPLALSAVPAAVLAHAPRASDEEGPPHHLRLSADGAQARANPERALQGPSPGESLSLSALLIYADEHAPQLAVVRASRAVADSELTRASALLPSNPRLEALLDPKFFGKEGGELEVSLKQEIEIAGQRGARIDAAKSAKELATAQIEDARWQLHCDLHAGFHAALVERENVLLADQVVAFQEEVLRVVERQVGAGEAAPLTLVLAQAEAAQARQRLIAAEQRMTASRLKLAQLSGWPASAPPMPSGALDLPREPPPLERLMSIANEHLPALQVKEARLREAEAEVTVARREIWPRDTEIGIQYRRSEGPLPEDRGQAFLGIIGFAIPSFQTNQGDRARARAEVSMARAELGVVRGLLEAQLAEARSQMIAALDRVRAYGDEILPRFERNLALLRRSFELGEIDLLALSSGREAFLRIQSDALEAQVDYFVAMAGLERLVGVELWHDDHDETTEER